MSCYLKGLVQSVAPMVDLKSCIISKKGQNGQSSKTTMSKHNSNHSACLNNFSLENGTLPLWLRPA
jgi:hypothetical protein